MYATDCVLFKQLCEYVIIVDDREDSIERLSFWTEGWKIGSGNFESSDCEQFLDPVIDQGDTSGLCTLYKPYN